MLRLPKVTLIITGLWFWTFVAFAARPSGLKQLLLLPLTLAFFVLGIISLFRALDRWPKERWRAVIPAIACVLAFVLALTFRGVMRTVLFDRSLPGYQHVIRQIESGSIPVSSKLQQLPQAESPWAYGVLAQRTNGVLYVEFLTGGGFPVKHSGYLYSSSGAIEEGSVVDSRWPKRRKVRPLWFAVSD